jgi:hypothetical protein
MGISNEILGKGAVIGSLLGDAGSVVAGEAYGRSNPIPLSHNSRVIISSNPNVKIFGRNFEVKKGLIIIMALGLLSSLAVGNAMGQVWGPPPVVNAPPMGPVMVPPPVVSAPPRWQHVPSVNGMEYAPGIHQDLFRYGGNYYQFHNGRWYQGRNYNGPWGMIHRPPQAFHQVNHHYWKTPPGWVKHRGGKNGWGGDHMPPGRAKKYRETYVHPHPYPMPR